MAIEKSQIKFAESEQTGEILGFVSRHSKPRRLKGVRENSHYGKKICVLSQSLKGKIIPNILYDVELKEMHSRNGYVVISAVPVQFCADIETICIPQNEYKVKITFGNKTIYFDPLNGNSPSSTTVEGVLNLLNSRLDIENLETVVGQFKYQALLLLNKMEQDGITSPKTD